MTICRPILYCLIAAVLVPPAGAAAALRPQEVVVVVNANAKDSVKLGRHYCLARNILPERMVVLRTTASAIVSRREYNDNIRAPLRRFLTEHKLKSKTKCLALMWGVPIRVLGTEPAPKQRKLISAYRTAGTRLHGRLTVNVELLRTVGVTFPPPRTKTLRPVGHLFKTGAGSLLGKPSDFSKLRREFGAELKRKQAGVAKLKDEAKRRISLRQLAALRQDTYGPGNLLKNMPVEPIAGVPAPDEIRRRIKSAAAELASLKGRKETPETIRKMAGLVGRRHGLLSAYDYCQKRLKVMDIVGEDASVDSELSLLWEDLGAAPLRGARPNPMFWRLAHAKSRPASTPKSIIMTARIDGPTAADALRIIKDSVEIEKTGLKGKFYIDAGGKYAKYDVHLMKLASVVKKHTRIPVVLDTKKALFRPRTCPDAALYVGWYSVRKYVPAFTWVRGSVGWHIASFEAHHLRASKVDEWCVKMIQNGVAATLGAVNEPYLHAFPFPEDFFFILLTGHRTVAECYWRSVPSVSWRLTLIADPLYNPYKLYPKISIYNLPPGLVGRPPIRRTSRPASKPTSRPAQRPLKIR